MAKDDPLARAVRLHQAGKLTEAEEIYRKILVRQPREPNALYLLGSLAHQTGRGPLAIELMESAIAANPAAADYHNNLGVILASQGNSEAAIDAYRNAISLRPQYPEAYYNLGLALAETNRLEAAADAYRQSISLQPNVAGSLNGLSLVLRKLGKSEEAVEFSRQAMNLDPINRGFQYNFYMALFESGRKTEALEVCRKMIQLNPHDARAMNDAGNILRDLGRLDEAIASYRMAISVDPGYSEAHTNLGNALGNAKQFDAAIASHRQAIRLKPDDPDAYNNLATSLVDIGRPDEAAAAIQEAIRRRPTYAGAYCNLGNILMNSGQFDAAIAAFRQAIRLQPDFAMAHSNLICTLHYHPGSGPELIHEELRRWDQQHAEPLRKFIQTHRNIRDPNRRLRIGYLSPDFAAHVVGYNLLPLLLHHDHSQMEIFCYSSIVLGDAFTEQLRQCANVWRDIVGLSDSQAADLIRQDGIDILVDLALHTSGNRLRIFARKPAPVQVTYLGYCSSTGLKTMDYRFSDPYLDPPNSDLSVYSEKTIRLPKTYWCYASAGQTPEPSPPPVEKAGYITFGCLNNFAKVSPAIDLWAEILNGVPRSRLIVHSQPGTHLNAVRERFEIKGISPDRLEFLGRQHWPEYVQTFGRIDIALDPFPWGGGITTCDALWMGVPVVTLLGRTAVGRGGASLLSNIGFPDLIARTPEQYVRIAIDLAQDLPRQAELRRTLRPRMQASPLKDAPLFARNVEAAYRQMWRNWCVEGAP